MDLRHDQAIRRLLVLDDRAKGYTQTDRQRIESGKQIECYIGDVIAYRNELQTAYVGPSEEQEEGPFAIPDALPEWYPKNKPNWENDLFYKDREDRRELVRKKNEVTVDEQEQAESDLADRSEILEGNLSELETSINNGDTAQRISEAVLNVSHSLDEISEIADGAQQHTEIFTILHNVLQFDLGNLNDRDKREIKKIIFLKVFDRFHRYFCL